MRAAAPKQSPTRKTKPAGSTRFGRALDRENRAGSLQRSPTNSQRTNEVPPIVHDVVRSPGQPLDTATRGFFEPRFGFDFSQVRTHTDTKAELSARTIHARAYTLGKEVVFGAGQFSPGNAAGQELLAHELAHVVQQQTNSTGPTDHLTVSAPGDAHEHEAATVASALVQGVSMPGLSRAISPTVVAREPDAALAATAEERRWMVDAAARWLLAIADQIQTLRRVAAAALATTVGSAAAPRAFHRHLNQAVLDRLMRNAISVFEAQRSDNPYVNFPAESPEQTRLGEAYARAIEQFGLAIEEARANALNLAPTVRETEEASYASNHLRWLEANPAAPLAAGVRTTFTQAESDISARRHQTVSSQLADLAATVHRYNLAGDGAQRLRNALQNALYRLAQNPVSGRVEPQRDTTLEASIQPILQQLTGIEWAIGQAVDRLVQAEARTRAFASDAAANPTVGAALQTHFSIRDPGYATLLADRFARMARELRGEGSLTIHARNPQDSECGVGNVGGGFSVTAAHAEANRFYFCGDVTVGNQGTVSTVIHETVHAVIPNLGARGPVTSSTETPRDRAYESERIYSRLSTEEALDNAESYSFYVDDLLGVQVSRTSAPRDVVTGCTETDTDTVHDAIARATYRIRLAAMWASQTFDRHRGTALPQYVVSIVQEGFPGADATRSREILTHLRNLAGSLDYYLPITCRRATDREARSGALVYGPRNAATAGSVISTSRAYPGGTLRICPAWFQAGATVREDALTAILVLRYRSSVPAADVTGLVNLARHIQEEAHPSVAGRTLPQHQAADAPPTPPP